MNVKCSVLVRRSVAVWSVDHLRGIVCKLNAGGLIACGEAACADLHVAAGMCWRRWPVTSTHV